MANEVLSEIRDGVCIISLNRPEKLNCLNEALIVGLKDALVAANKNAEVQAIVLRGNGRAFSSGDDLKDSHDNMTGKDQNRDFVIAYSETLQDVTREIYHGEKFVIGAIHGYAVGAGFEWAINCDFSIWAHGTQAFLPEMKWGMFPTGGITALLPSLVGITKAKEILLFGDRYSAEELHKIGIAWKVVDEDKVLDEAIATAKRIGEFPSRATRDLKRTLHKCCFGDLEKALTAETEGIVAAVLDPDTRGHLSKFSDRSR